MASLGIELPDDFVGALADALAPLIAERLQPEPPQWLTARQAAEHLNAPLSRVRKLTSTDALPVHREGGRVLYLRAELDEFIRRGGACAH
jgi:excisionase family DNA binding protein